MVADSIMNYKTVASIANYDIFLTEYQAITSKIALVEIKEATCEGFQFGFSQFMQNGAFGVLYLVQAFLVYYFEGYEPIEPKNMFTAMFSVMFGVFTAVQAMAQI